MTSGKQQTGRKGVGLIVRPTAIFIEDDKILLVKQEVTEKRHWALPGGALEAGETIEQCLIREVKEETGLDIRVKKLLYVTDRFYRNIHIVHILFLVEKTGGRLRSGRELKSGTDKIKELAWIPAVKLPDYGFPLNMCRLINSGFPGSGSYKGDFEKFYGKL
jgi:mutator protein MutT